MSNPWKCTNSGTSVLLTTFTVTGTPSFIRSRGPGELPLYPMVLIMRLGASSTVTGAISSVKSVFAKSSDPAGTRKDCGCCATIPAILRNSRLSKSRPSVYDCKPTLRGEADDFKFRGRIHSCKDLVHATHRLVLHFDLSALAALEDWQGLHHDN